jgi:hemerythrin-like domain-containing protein
MDGIEDALLRSHAQDFVGFATRLADILRNHIDKEEHVLFPLIDNALSPQSDGEVVRQFQAFDRDFKERGRDGLLERLAILEGKYLSRAA